MRRSAFQIMRRIPGKGMQIVKSKMTKSTAFDAAKGMQHTENNRPDANGTWFEVWHEDYLRPIISLRTTATEESA